MLLNMNEGFLLEGIFPTNFYCRKAGWTLGNFTLERYKRGIHNQVMFQPTSTDEMKGIQRGMDSRSE